MSSDSKTLTASEILKLSDNTPDGFTSVDLKNIRSSKRGNKYADVYIHADGKNKRKFSFTWSNQKLTGGIKCPEDRGDKPPAAQFRRSSGDIGEMLFRAYEIFEKEVRKALNNKVIKVKKGKDIFFNIIQYERDGEAFDDPIIRMKFPFDRMSGNALFECIQISKNKNGKMKQTNIKCTLDNIHEIIRGRMVTAGYAVADSLIVSQFGVSIPCTIKKIIIKPLEKEVPKITDILSEEQMLAMAVDDENDDEDSSVDDDQGSGPGDEEGDSNTEGNKSTESMLADLNISE
jgi:hypothetical protein